MSANSGFASSVTLLPFTVLYTDEIVFLLNCTDYCFILTIKSRTKLIYKMSRQVFYNECL